MCFNMLFADWSGFSQSLFMLIASPQSMHVMKVPPAIFLVVYIALAYTSLSAKRNTSGQRRLPLPISALRLAKINEDYGY